MFERLKEDAELDRMIDDENARLWESETKEQIDIERERLAGEAIDQLNKAYDTLCEAIRGCESPADDRVASFCLELELFIDNLKTARRDGFR